MIDERRFPGRQGRLLFAYLVAEQGRPVPRDELAEVLWGQAPPATWEKALSVLVSKLRALLSENGIDGPVALTGAFGCYRLELPEGSWVDVVSAAKAATEAEAALATGELENAEESAALAESLLRQPFLPGDDGNWVEEKRREIAEVRSRALRVLAESGLRSGDAREAGKWATELIALEPFRESGYRQLMKAHVAAGNRAEALRVYERIRRLLADELGAYPSPETESLYRELLEQAPAGPTATHVATREEREPAAVRRRSRKRIWIPAVSSLAIAAAVLAGVLATKGGGTQRAVAPNSIVALDSSGKIDATVPVGARPIAVASGAGSLWVANLDDESVTRVDTSSREPLPAIAIRSAPTAIAATRTSVWVADSAGRVSRIDPTYDRLASTRQLAPKAVIGCCDYAASSPRPTLVAFGSLWVVDPTGYVSRIDLVSGRREASVDVGNEPSAVAAGAGSVWVTNSTDGTVTRIDPATLLTETIPVGHGPAAVSVDRAGAWIANAGDDTVVRVDPATDAVTDTMHVGAGPDAVLATTRRCGSRTAATGP